MEHLVLSSDTRDPSEGSSKAFVLLCNRCKGRGALKFYVIKYPLCTMYTQIM